MHELLAGTFRPITDTIGFIRCPPETVVEAYLAWQGRIHTPRGVTLAQRPVAGRLADALGRLLPLTSVERRRFIFAPTASDWTAYFDNGHQGADVFPPLSYLARELGCDSLRASDLPDDIGATASPGRILELWGAEERDFLNYKRSIGASIDGSRWTFSAEGEVQPFEQVQRYGDRMLKRRFTSGMLDDYLGALGIRAGDAAFYMPAGTATLVEKRGPIAAAARTFSLDEAR